MTEPTLRKAKIDEFRPQEQNANRHTQRGMRELEKSIGEDGYVAPMSAAADGELLDGSARLETVANLFDEEVFVVEHDGSVPIVMKRTDIPDAKADIARRIAIRANRIAELNLDWDAGVLLGSAEGLDLGRLFTDRDLAEISNKQVNYDELWQGMPEFGDEAKAYKTIHIHFANEQDMIEFEKEYFPIGETVTFWYPPRSRRDMSSLVFKDES